MSNRPWSDESTVVPEVTDLILYKKPSPSTVQNLATLDQLLSLKQSYWDTVINKSADSSVASTTFITIPDFSIGLAQGTYMFELRLEVETSTDDDIQIRMNTVGTIGRNVWGRQSDDFKSNVISLTESYDFLVATSGLLILQGIVEFTGTGPNTLNAQFAKVADVSGTTEVRLGSTFSLRKVA